MDKEELFALVKQEGDKKLFTYEGFECAIIRNTRPGFKFLCGYVNIREDISFDLEDNIDVHGGITYQSLVPENSDWLPSGYWLGFDCGHFGDLCPGAFEVFPEVLWPDFEEEEYRTMEYVENQIKRMVHQLIKMGVKPYDR